MHIHMTECVCVCVYVCYLKYLVWEPRFLSMASSEPIPLYFFSLMPSEKKYSPGASLVAAINEPIITERERNTNNNEILKAITLKVSQSTTQSLVVKKILFIVLHKSSKTEYNASI